MMIDRKSPRRPRGSTSLRVRTALASPLIAATVIPGIASATLGEDGSTVERDRAQMQAQRLIAQSTGYTVHELQLPGGTTVREYLTNTNQVFAIAWRGPSIPDLKVLLGTHFARFSAAAQAAGRARHALIVQDPDLVIHSGGHPRAFSGMAYLPQRMPPGVTAEQIR